MNRAKVVAFALCAALLISLDSWAQISLRNTSTDQPLLLNRDTDYQLQSVNVTGIRDNAAITLAGKIKSVSLRKCTIGNVRAGEGGRAVGIDAAGASVGSFVATDSVFFDCENELLSFKEGSFGVVTIQRCAFSTSDRFLKEIYTESPWRDTPPVTEFQNIDRLELLDNIYHNTVVIIHPSVKKVLVRGELPGLIIDDKESTQVIRLAPGQDPATIGREELAMAN